MAKISLRRKRALRKQAARDAAAAKLGQRLGRTGQVSRSTVITPEGDVDLSDAVVTVGDTSRAVVAHGDDLDYLSEGLDTAREAATDLVGRSEDDAVATHDADMRAIDASLEIQTTQTAVGDAVDKAVSATNTALGFARYRYFPDTGVHEPPLPEEGPHQYAERTHIDADGKPVKVEVFDGVQWNLHEVLLARVVALDEDGASVIEGGQMYSPRMVSPEIIGGDVYATTFRGSEYELSDALYSEDELLLHDPCQDTTPWQVAPWDTTELSTSPVAYVAPTAIQGALSGIAATAYRGLGPYSLGGAGGFLTIWVRSSLAGQVVVQVNRSENLGPILGSVVVEAGVYAQVRVDLPPGSTITSVRIDKQGNTDLLVDELYVWRHSGGDSTVRIARDASGYAEVRTLHESSGAYVAMRGGTLESSYGGLLPVGAVLPFAAAVAPPGFLVCAGQTLQRSVYGRLFDVIGYTYGGSGALFVLPDLRVRIPVGIGSALGTVVAMGDAGGEAEHTLVVSEIPSHNHGGTSGSTTLSGTMTSGSGTSNAPTRGGGSSTAGVTFTGTGHTHSIPAQGGGLPHNNMQPYVGMRYIIKT